MALPWQGSRLFSADITGTLDGCPAAVGMNSNPKRTAAAGSVLGMGNGDGSGGSGWLRADSQVPLFH